MLAQAVLAVLIIEPNRQLVMPYGHLPNSYIVNRFPTVELALVELTNTDPDIVFLSASFSPSKSVRFLEALKNFSKTKLIPLLIVVDLSHRLNFVPGTSWGGKIAVLDSFASKRELYSTLDRVLQI